MANVESLFLRIELVRVGHVGYGRYLLHFLVMSSLVHSL